MTELQSEFFHDTVPAALLSQHSSGVPASITLAQAILESGWGRSGLARIANNFFGIKAGANASPDEYVEMPTHEVVNGVSELEMARFARYPSIEACFKAHGALLALASRYHAAMEAAHDPAAFAAELQKCGYSTNPNYSAELMRLVREFDLGQYDAAPNPPAAAANHPSDVDLSPGTPMNEVAA